MTPSAQSGPRDDQERSAPAALRRHLVDAFLNAGCATLLRPEPVHWTREYAEEQLALYERIRMLDPEQAWRVVRLCCFGEFTAAEALAVVTHANRRSDS